MDTNKRLQMAKAGFVEVAKIPPYRKSGITLKQYEPASVTTASPVTERRAFNTAEKQSNKSQVKSGYQYDLKLSSDISIPSTLHPASLLCTICEVCLRILHFGDISNESIPITFILISPLMQVDILDEIIQFGALIGEKSSKYVFSLKEAFYRCPRYSRQMYFMHSLFSIVPQNDREALQNVLHKLARTSSKKPVVAIFTRVVLTDRDGLSAGPDFRYENDEEEEMSGKNALVVGMHAGSGTGGGGVMFYLNTKLEFFDSDTADFFTFSLQNNQKNAAVVFKWVENSMVRIQEYLEKMFAKRNDEMTQLYKLKMRKRGLVREDEGERKKEILWVVNVVSLRNEAIYVPHNVADETLVYESAYPQAISSGLADGFFTNKVGVQLSTEVSHLQDVNEELNAKIIDLESEIELQKQEYELKISELETQFQKLELVLLHEQPWNEDLTDDDEKVRMKGFVQGQQVAREQEREAKELGRFRELAEREMVDYGKEIEVEEKKKALMKDAFLFAKERQAERALKEKTQLQKSYQKAIVKNWGEFPLDKFATIAPKPQSPITVQPHKKSLPAPDLCVVCNTHKPISQIRILTNCSHSVCADCLRVYLVTWMKVPFPIQCPIGKKLIQNIKCSVPVSHHDISTVLGAKARQCPKCRMWIVQQKGKDVSEGDRMVCECGASSCYNCGTAEWPCSTCLNRLL